MDMAAQYVYNIYFDVKMNNSLKIGFNDCVCMHASVHDVSILVRMSVCMYMYERMNLGMYV